jgi:hypothetical protein
VDILENLKLGKVLITFRENIVNPLKKTSFSKLAQKKQMKKRNGGILN